MYSASVLLTLCLVLIGCSSASDTFPPPLQRQLPAAPEKKPVGQVVFARALRGQDPDDYFTQRVQFDSKDRAAIRHAATLFALDLLQPAKDSLRPSEDIALPAA